MTKIKEFMHRYSTYIKFVAIGVGLEIPRLFSFKPFESVVPTEVANILSLIVGVSISFLFHYFITWADVPGSAFIKFAKYWISEILIIIGKGFIFRWMLQYAFLSCPFMWVVDWLIEKFPLFTLLSEELVSCGTLASGLMDGVLGVTIVYLIHKYWTFGPPPK